MDKTQKCFEGLTEEQLKLFDQMKTKVSEAEISDDYCTNRCLLRYLRARQWNVDQAWDMIQGTLQWRKDFQPDAITIEQISEEAATGKMYISPFKDKAERPIVVMRPGLDTTKDRIAKVKYLVWIVENAIKTMKPEENGVEKITLLIDFTGVGMALAGVDNTKVSLEVLNILQNHYPERLGRALMVSPPWIFSAFWKVIKPLLDPVTQEKIIFVKDKKKDSKTVKDTISEENLEQDFGGSSTWQYEHEQWLKETPA